MWPSAKRFGSSSRSLSTASRARSRRLSLALCALLACAWLLGGTATPAGADPLPSCTLTDLTGTPVYAVEDYEGHLIGFECFDLGVTPEVDWTLFEPLPATGNEITVWCYTAGDDITGGSGSFAGSFTAHPGSTSAAGGATCELRASYTYGASSQPDPGDFWTWAADYSDHGESTAFTAVDFEYADEPVTTTTTTTVPEEGGAYDGPTAEDFHDLEQEVLVGLGLLVFIGAARMVGGWGG